MLLRLFKRNKWLEAGVTHRADECRLRRQVDCAHRPHDRGHPSRTGEQALSDPHTRNVGVAAGALLASASTLVCCPLPAVLVSVGAGAALLGLVTAVPQLVWLSEHKDGVFGFAAAALIAGGALLWSARRMPCPADPVAARRCARLRRASGRLYAVAVAAFVVGATFAFLLPQLS